MTSPVPVPDLNRATATPEQKLEWIKARAGNEPWGQALSSVIQDAGSLDMPLKADAVALGMIEAMSGDRAARQFVDALTLASFTEAGSDD